ncbi:sugar transferase, partial [Acinetobacter baumannii]
VKKVIAKDDINEAGEATMSKFIGSEEKDIEKK